MHATGVTEKESEDAIRQHAGALLDQLNRVHERFNMRRQTLSAVSLPPENVPNPLETLLSDDE